MSTTTYVDIETEIGDFVVTKNGRQGTYRITKSGRGCLGFQVPSGIRDSGMSPLSSIGFQAADLCLSDIRQLRDALDEMIRTDSKARED